MLTCDDNSVPVIVWKREIVFMFYYYKVICGYFLIFFSNFFALPVPEINWTKFQWSAWIKILENMSCMELSRNLIEAVSVSL